MTDRTLPADECAVFRCQNKRTEGQFVGDFCAPCDSSIRSGLIAHGTSFIHQLAAENSRLRAELAYYEDEGDDYE